MRPSLLMLLVITACSDPSGPGSDPPLAGRIVFVSDTGVHPLLHMAEDGTDVRAIPLAMTGFIGSVDVAPDGRRLVFSHSTGGPSDIYTVTAFGDQLVNLTNTPSNDLGPRWSADGRQIVFASNRRTNGELDILLMEADGTGAQYLVSSDLSESAPHLSVDGASLLFTRIDATGNWDIWMLSRTTGSELRLTDDPLNDLNASWSPDGTTIAFRSLRGSGSNLWLMDPDGGDIREIEPSDGGSWGGSPRWSPDGTRLAFEEGTNDLRVVTVGGQLVFGPVRGRHPTWGPAE